MKNEILSTVDFCGVVTEEELFEILKDYIRNFKPGSFGKYVKSLKEDLHLFGLKSGETDLDGDSYILGPTAEFDFDSKLKDYLLDRKTIQRDLGIVDWNQVTARHMESLKKEVEMIKEDALGLYKPPKRIELDYFDLSIKYHQMLGFFDKHYKSDPLEQIEEELKECKRMIDNLQKNSC